MRAFSVVSTTFLFVVTVLGITVTSPVEGAFWDASKSTQSVSWTSVSSDPNNFTISLVNMVTYPNVNVVLKEDVLTSSGSATVNAPSSGWPTGHGFQINLVQQNPTGVAILAQSQQFNITGTPSSSVSSPSRSSTTLSANSKTANGGSPSSTDTSLPSETGTTQGNTGGAMSLTVQMSYIVGFALVGALLA